MAAMVGLGCGHGWLVSEEVDIPGVIIAKAVETRTAARLSDGLYRRKYVNKAFQVSPNKKENSHVQFFRRKKNGNPEPVEQGAERSC